jgi:hypothetical protein
MSSAPKGIGGLLVKGRERVDDETVKAAIAVMTVQDTCDRVSSMLLCRSPRSVDFGALAATRIFCQRNARYIARAIPAPPHFSRTHSPIDLGWSTDS